MSNTIDCSIMSHVACEGPDPVLAAPLAGARQSVSETPAGPPPLVASYDCVNRCASSLGVVALVDGAVAGLGCVALPPACPAFLAAVPITILEACNDACRELERP